MNRTKKILAAVLAFAMIAAMSVFAFADGDVKTGVRLGDVTVYEATKDESIVTMPIIVDGTIDMQAYDITITWDKSWLYTDDTKAPIAGITAFEGGYKEINSSEKGVLRIAGVTTDEDALNATGEVGTVSFVVGKRAMKATDVKVEITAAEFGFGTEAAELTYTAGIVTLTKDKAPEETPTPEPTATPEPTQEPVAKGDVNEDGKINATDALAVLEHAANKEGKVLEGDAFARADMDDSGIVNASDALAILKIAANITE